MSLLDRNGLGDWLAERLVTIGDTVKDNSPVKFPREERHPFLDDRLRVANLPIDPQTVNVTNRLFRRGEAGRRESLPQAG